MADVFLPKWKEGNGRAFMEGLERHLRFEADLERVDFALRAEAANAEVRDMGSAKMDGLGQLKAVIPAREYFRWHQSHEGCWGDKGFIREFVRDNPEMRGEGTAA